MTLSRPGRRHREQRVREFMDWLTDDGPEPDFDGAIDGDPRDYEPDGYSQAEIDRRGDEAADRYEKEMDARW